MSRPLCDLSYLLLERVGAVLLPGSNYPAPRAKLNVMC